LGALFAALSPPGTKSFKSMVGGFKSNFVSDTHPLIAQPRPSTATYASTGVPRLPVLAMCPWEGVKSAATSGMPKTRPAPASKTVDVKSISLAIDAVGAQQDSLFVPGFLK
jgi:hypothetical protein